MEKILIKKPKNLKTRLIKNGALKIAAVAFVLTAGYLAVSNVPNAVEEHLPEVETKALSPTKHSKTVFGSGIITNGLSPEEIALEENGDWFVNVFIGESDIRYIEEGQNADISGVAFDDDIYTATVHEISKTATQKQSEFTSETVIEVILKIDNPDNSLKNGYTAHADIKVEDEKTLNIIPYEAINQDDEGEYVYVVSGNTVKRKNITTGIELSDGAEVVEGIENGERVILSSSNLKITDGMLVLEKNKEKVDE